MTLKYKVKVFVIILALSFVLIATRGYYHKSTTRNQLQASIDTVSHLLQEYYRQHGTLPPTYETIRIDAERGAALGGFKVPSGASISWIPFRPVNDRKNQGIGEISISASIDGEHLEEKDEFIFLDQNQYWLPHYRYNAD